MLSILQPSMLLAMLFHERLGPGLPFLCEGSVQPERADKFSIAYFDSLHERKKGMNRRKRQTKQERKAGLALSCIYAIRPLPPVLGDGRGDEVVFL
jgi:hypothetical protein